MRTSLILTLLAALISGCSLMRARGPGDGYRAQAAPECDPSAGPPIADLSIATGAALFAALAAAEVAGALPAQQASAGALAGFGAGALGFAGSGIFGVVKVGQCKAGWAAWDAGAEQRAKAAIAENLERQKAADAEEKAREKQAADAAERTAISLVVAQTACPREGAVIKSGLRQWSVSICERNFVCQAGQSNYPETCTETADSVERTAQRIAADRLALETGCPSADVRLVEAMKWTRGTERAFRFAACGKPYVCTTAAGRTDCKAALAAVEAASP